VDPASSPVDPSTSGAGLLKRADELIEQAARRGTAWT
jgi:hypothetical protein